MKEGRKRWRREGERERERGREREREHQSKSVAFSLYRSSQKLLSPNSPVAVCCRLSEEGLRCCGGVMPLLRTMLTK
eukprot:1353901-Rhodomonas_salina.2